MYAIYPVVVMLIWSGNVIVSRLAVGAIHPSAITFYRLVFALLLMSSFVLRPLWRNRAAVKPQLPKLFFLGFLAFALFQSLSYAAAQTTTATNMAIITALTPLLTLLLSMLLLGELPTAGMLLGGCIAFAGLLDLIGQGHPLALWQNGVHRGDVLMLGSASAYALYGVLVRRWHVGLPAWQSTWVQACGALLCMLPMLLRLPLQQALPNRASLPLILYAGTLASVVLPFLWMESIKHLGPARCSAYISLLPVFTALIAVSFFGETLHAYHLLGGGVALAGVVIAQRWKQPLVLRRVALR